MRALLLAAALALGAGPAMAQLFGGQELLDPDKAFRISARALDARNVEVTFQIADGYYMYRDRMLVVWPFDENGTLIGEDSYSGQAGFVGIADRKVPNDELPPEIRK